MPFEKIEHPRHIRHLQPNDRERTERSTTKDKRQQVPVAEAGTWIFAPVSGSDRTSPPRLIDDIIGPLDKNFLVKALAYTNLEFQGPYVDGPPPEGYPIEYFTHRSRDPENKYRWIAAMKTIEQLGWGFSPFYMAYSQAPGTRRELYFPTALDAEKVGAAQARHIKGNLAFYGGDFAGCVVIVDNEDNKNTQLSEQMITYYLTLFAELAKEGPGELPAIRPGIYTHGELAGVLVSHRPDLFVWDVKIQSFASDPFFAMDKTGITFPTLKMRAFRFGSGKKSRCYWPLGRQYVHNYAVLPPEDGPLSKHKLPQQKKWDFDCSFVRNPMYPVVQPQCKAFDSDTIIATLIKKGTIDFPPLTSVRVINSEPKEVPNGQIVQLDSPLRGADFKNERHLVSLSNGGHFVRTSKSAGASWTAFSTLAQDSVSLRRNYAFDLVATKKLLRLVFVGRDNKLYARESADGIQWSSAGLLHDKIGLHPFSKLGCATVGDETVIACISKEGFPQFLAVVSFSVVSVTRFQ